MVTIQTFEDYEWRVEREVLGFLGGGGPLVTSDPDEQPKGVWYTLTRVTSNTNTSHVQIQIQRSRNSLTTVNAKHCTCSYISPTNTMRSKIRGQHFVTKHHHGQWAPPGWARSHKCFVGFSWQMRCRIFNNQRDDFSNKFLGAAAHGVASTTWAGWLHQSPDLKSKSLNFHKLPFLRHFVVQCFSQILSSVQMFSTKLPQKVNENSSDKTMQNQKEYLPG